MNKETTIKVSLETRERLKRYGNKGETYDELLNRLLDEVKEDRRRLEGGEGDA